MNHTAFAHAIRVLTEVSLNQIARAHFNLAAWLEIENGYDEWDPAVVKAFNEDLANSPLTIPHQCGTTACAIGYMGLDPWFRDQGMQTTRTGELIFLEQVPDSVSHRTYYNWGAVEKMFGISEDDAEYLFQTDSYRPDIRMAYPFVNNNDVTVEEVLERLHVYVNNNGARDV